MSYRFLQMPSRPSRRAPVVLAVFGAVIGLPACSVSSDLLGPGAGQGIEGIALLGPQCPVQSA